MDTFIYYGDYNKQIQTDNLQQIIGGQQNVLDAIQMAAVNECVSYLKAKYDVSRAFRPVKTWVLTNTYDVFQTVYLNAPAFDAISGVYEIGSTVVQSGIVYSCTTAIPVPGAWVADNWIIIGVQYSLYFVTQPHHVFNCKHLYSIGDVVFWRNKVYTCQIASSFLSHEGALEIGHIVDSNILNVFPDDIRLGVKNWGVGSVYNVPANTPLTNTTYWTPGDCRDQKLLMTCVDIAIYHLHSRVAPRNVPENRIHRYMGIPEDRAMKGGRVIYPTYSALGWLQAAADGTDITPELPLIQPQKGRRVRYGGNVKLINTY